MHAEVLLKATQVDGIYSADPRKDPDATLLPKLTYHEVLTRNLQVMDAAAIALCRENHVPIVVFDLMKEGNIRRVVCGGGDRIGRQRWLSLAAEWAVPFERCPAHAVRDILVSSVFFGPCSRPEQFPRRW